MNRLIVFLTGVVLVGIAGFALVWFGVGRELQPHVARTLVDLRDGNYRAVHERAHASFRKRHTPTDLEAYWTWWSARKGSFFEILARRGIGTSMRDGETRKTITLDVGFKQGKLRAKFEFVAAEPEPLLTHFRLSELDEGRGTKDDREQLVERADGLFRLCQEQDPTGLYAAFSFELQKSLPAAALGEQLAARLLASGKLVRWRLLSTTEDGDRVTQDFEAEYERGMSIARIVQRFDDGRWHVDGFALHVDGYTPPRSR